MDMVQALSPGQRTALRLIGGPLLATAALTISLRMGIGDTWSHFTRFALLAGVAAFLFLMALGVVELPAADEEEPIESVWWRVAYLVAALVLLPFAFSQFVESVDGDPGSGFNIAWYFTVAAVAAWFPAWRLRLPFAALAGGLFVIVAWIGFWADALEEPDLDSFRWILLVSAAGLAWAAYRLRRVNAPEAADLVTAAGVAGVIAGTIGSVGQPIPTAFFSQFAVFGVRTELSNTEADGWQLFLLAVALTLIWLAARLTRRGPGYVGAVGLAIFAATAAAEILRTATSLFAPGQDPAITLAGWPLLLFLAAVAVMLAGWLRRPEPAPPEDPGPSPPAGPRGAE